MTPEQLARRQLGIGASEAAAILGLSRYATAEDIWLLKTGQAQSFEGNRYTRWGQLLEDDIAEEYQAQNPGVILEPMETIYEDASRMFCTPDRRVSMPDGFGGFERWGLECKNKAYSQRPKWKDGVPPDVLAQVHWSLTVTEWDRWDVAVLLGGNDWRQYTVNRMEEMDVVLLEIAAAFWQAVEQRIHPSNFLPEDLIANLKHSLGGEVAA